MLIEIANRQTLLPIDEERLRTAVRRVLEEARIDGEISVAIVDDAAIHALNREYLHHDYPTDVLSFVLDRHENRLDGEIIVSAETAMRVAAEVGWQPADELLLYVIHGTLHLVGFDDVTPEARVPMRDAERRHLEEFGLDRHD